MLSKLTEIVSSSKVKISILLFSIPILAGCPSVTYYQPSAKVDNECKSIEEAYQSKCSSFYGEPDYKEGFFGVTGQGPVYRIPRSNLYPIRPYGIIRRRTHPRY